MNDSRIYFCKIVDSCNYNVIWNKSMNILIKNNKWNTFSLQHLRSISCCWQSHYALLSMEPTRVFQLSFFYNLIQYALIYLCETVDVLDKSIKMLHLIKHIKWNTFSLQHVRSISYCWQSHYALLWMGPTRVFQ